MNGRAPKGEKEKPMNSAEETTKLGLHGAMGKQLLFESCPENCENIIGKFY